MEMSSYIKAVVVAANQYRNNNSEVHLVHLQRQLDVLISVTSKGSLLTYFDPHELAPTECLTCLVEIMNNLQVKPSLSQRCMLLLGNLANDESIRVILQSTYHLTACLAKYLHSYTGPSFNATDPIVLQCVKLLQQITYNCRISFQETYVEDLIKFTVRHVLSPESHLFQCYLGLLANLCRHNFSVQSFVKNLKNVKVLYKVLFTSMNHADQKTVVFALTIFVSLCLQEDIGEMLFKPKNIHGTFQLIFNILVMNNSTTARRYAVDLLTDLIHQPRIQQSLLKYEHLNNCIKQILNLISEVNSDSAVKIFELLLSFCSVNGLRCVVCRTLLESPTLQDSGRFKELLSVPKAHTAEPLLAVVHWAAQSVETHDKAPLLALEFLREVYQEVIDLGRLDHISPRTDLILPMLTEILMTPIKVDGPNVRKHCLRTVRAIQLLIALCGEPSIQPEVAKSLDTKTCIGLVEHQLNHNRIALTHIHNTADPENWSDVGVEVVAHSLDLMLRVRRLVPTMEASIHQLLQDARLVPFLAFAITSDNRELVQVALKLVTHGASLPEFPTVILGESIAANNAQSVRRVEYKEINQDDSREPPHKRFAWSLSDDGEKKPTVKPEIKRENSNEALETSVELLIEKMQTGMELKDMRASEIINVYEHKLQTVQTKENHLQDLLEAKALALAQADRLISQYRCRRAQSEAEAQRIRTLLGESEKRAEEFQEQVNEMRLEKDRLTTDLDQFYAENQRLESIAADHVELTNAYQDQSQRLETAQRTLDTLKQEHETMTEMHEMLRRHNETLKQKHDVASEQVISLEEERKTLTRNVKEKDGQVAELTKKLSKSDDKLKTTKIERDELEKSIDKLRLDLGKTEKTKKEFQHQVSTLELVCQQHEDAIQEKDRLIRAQKTELDKHAQIAALIHNLSSGTNPNGKAPDT